MAGEIVQPLLRNAHLTHKPLAIGSEPWPCYTQYMIWDLFKVSLGILAMVVLAIGNLVYILMVFFLLLGLAMFCGIVGLFSLLIDR